MLLFYVMIRKVKFCALQSVSKVFYIRKYIFFCFFAAIAQNIWDVDERTSTANLKKVMPSFFYTSDFGQVLVPMLLQDNLSHNW